MRAGGEGYGRYSMSIYETEVKVQILCFLAVNCCVFKPVSLLELIMGWVSWPGCSLMTMYCDYVCRPGLTYHGSQVKSGCPPVFV